ncbi:hypothetical protein D3C81_833220 [compost metagenome]
MHIVFIRLGVMFPYRTAEIRFPIIRVQPIDTFTPDIITAFGVIFRRTGFDEPGMFVRGMIKYKIHHDLQSAGMSLHKQVVEILHRAELGINCIIVADIISVIFSR